MITSDNPRKFILRAAILFIVTTLLFIPVAIAGAHPNHGEGESNSFDTFVTDVEPGSAKYPFIKHIYEEGIIHCFSNGTCRPNVDATRGDVFVMISNLITQYFEPKFAAVKDDITELQDAVEIERVVTNASEVTIPNTADTYFTKKTECPDGMHATGGGASIEGNGRKHVHVTKTSPSDQGLDDLNNPTIATDWEVEVYRAAVGNATLETWVICETTN